MPANYIAAVSQLIYWNHSMLLVRMCSLSFNV